MFSRNMHPVTKVVRAENYSEGYVMGLGKAIDGRERKEEEEEEEKRGGREYKGE